MGEKGSATAILESKAWCLALAALMGLGLALFVYPPSFIAGEAARFQAFDLHANDAVEYWLAWRALVEHGRPWPSLWSDVFNHPEGFPVTILDGLPLAATLVRPLLPWLPEGFHYFGLWTAFAVVLQGVAGVVLARAAGLRHVAPCLCAAVLALCMPIFVGRLVVSHVALSTQGLLILALALCVQASRKPPPLVRIFPCAAAVALAALAVHPLLGLQVLLFGLLALGLAPAPALHRACAGFALALLCALLCWGLGLFSLAGLGNKVGLGSFGFSPWAMLAGEPDALRELYRLPSSEQDAWLGWGCILLLAAAVILPPRLRLRSTALAWMVLALAVVAISPWLRHGTHFIDFSSLLPDFVIDLYAMHRATVRLAWPAVICLTFLPLAHIVRTWPRRRAAVALSLALPLQLLSIYPYWESEHRQARLPTPSLAPLPSLLDGGSRLLTLPEAGGEAMTRVHLRYAKHLALETQMPLEGGGFARPPKADYDRRRRDLETSQGPGARYLAAAPPAAARLGEAPPQNPPPSAIPQSLPPVPDPLHCTVWEVLLVCRAVPLDSNIGSIRPSLG